MASKSREKRTAAVVKSILARVKERLLISGSLLAEEETAINQLENLYVAKFLRSDGEEFESEYQDSVVSFSVCKMRDSNQRLSLLSPRRDSDVSFSNDTNLSHSLSSSKYYRMSKDYNYYGRDPWRRQWQRKRRLELRKVEPLILRIDQSKGVDIIRAAASTYEELVLQGKAPLAAYDLLITTLRSYFSGETWPELVEVRVGRFIRKHLLTSIEEVAAKYSGGQESVTNSAEHLDECKLQALLHLHARSVDADTNSENREVLDLLHVISREFGGRIVLERFMDEEVLDSFLESLPRHLARLHEDMDVQLPPELEQYASGDKANNDGDQTKKKAIKTKKTPKVLIVERPRPTKRRRTIAIDEEKPADIPQHSVSETAEPKMDGVEEKNTVVKVEVEAHENHSVDPPSPQPLSLINPNLTDDQPVVKVIADTETPAAVLVSVRQSPRHHASTRALYGSSSNTLSLLLRKECTDGGGAARNGCVTPVPAMADTSSESTRLVLVKDKRGYFLKKFLHVGSNGKNDVHTPEESMSTTPSPPITIKIKKENGSTICQKSTTKNGGKKKAIAVKERPNEDEGAAITKKKSEIPKICKKSISGRIEKNLRPQRNPKLKITANRSSISAASPNEMAEEREEHVHKMQRQTSCRDQEPRSVTRSSKSRSEQHPEKGVSSKSIKPKSSNAGKVEVDYAMPSYAVENYAKYINDIRRERKRGRSNDPDDLFYARGTRRYSIFYEGAGGECNPKSPVSKCYTDEQMAPKNRSGRKMKSSVEVFHLANYLLNVQNQNPSAAPAVPKNLQQALNTPIRLYKKLRLAPKNSRRRSLKQFCDLKFKGAEFKVQENGGETRTSSSLGGYEEPNSGETEEQCASPELNCGEIPFPSPIEERADPNTALTVDIKMADDSPRRNSISICAGLSKWHCPTWTGGETTAQNPNTSGNGYYLRRRRLFSDGHMSPTLKSSVISPIANGTRRIITRRYGSILEEAKTKDVLNEKTAVATGGAENGLLLIADAAIHHAHRNLDSQSISVQDGLDQNGPYLNGLSTHHAGGLLHMCTDITAKNFVHVAAMDVH